MWGIFVAGLGLGSGVLAQSSELFSCGFLGATCGRVLDSEIRIQGLAD